MKSITNKEADQWIAGMTPEEIRLIVQQHHALRHGLCYQVLHIATGADDWVERSIEAAGRVKQCEVSLRKLVYEVENSCAVARNDVRETTCRNCAGSGQAGDGSCCVCRGTGLRSFA